MKVEGYSRVLGVTAVGLKLLFLFQRSSISGVFNNGLGSNCCFEAFLQASGSRQLAFFYGYRVKGDRFLKQGLSV